MENLELQLVSYRVALIQSYVMVQITNSSTTGSSQGEWTG